MSRESHTAEATAATSQMRLGKVLAPPSKGLRWETRKRFFEGLPRPVLRVADGWRTG